MGTTIHFRLASPLMQSAKPTSEAGSDCFQAVGQLANCLVELNRLLHEERTRSNMLMEENITLKSQLAQISTIQSHQKRSSSDNAKQSNDTSNKENPTTRQSKTLKDQTTVVSDAIEQDNGLKKKKRKRSKAVQNTTKDATSDKIEVNNAIQIHSSIADAASQVNTNAKEKNSKHNESGVWKKDTVLIVGDSMIFNIDENTLSRRYHTKVRSFPGSTVLDLHDYIKPLLRKQPDKIILVMGTNDIAHESVCDVLKRIKSLIKFIHEEVPQCHVVVSEIIRRGKNSNLNSKLNKFNQDLKSMNLDNLRQQNIIYEHIGRRGLHLNSYGDTQLAKNLVSKIRSFSTSSD